jgi:hypothetical protein
MKDILLAGLILLLGWVILRGQTKVLKRAWKRTIYHWHQTTHHFAEVSILIGVSFLGVLLVFIVLYALYLGGE